MSYGCVVRITRSKRTVKSWRGTSAKARLPKDAMLHVLGVRQLGERHAWSRAEWFRTERPQVSRPDGDIGEPA